MDNSQLSLEIASSPSNSNKKKRTGPPNRMNDLEYSEWMKFQKSFFRHESYQLLVEECIRFFTKSVWPNGESSRSLIVGFEAFDSQAIPEPRIVDTQSIAHSFSAIEQTLDRQDDYDFAMVDLRAVITSEGELDQFLSRHADTFFTRLRKLLSDGRYCAIVVRTPETGGAGFPIPWSVALSCRDHLKLRDEKVGLIEDEERLYYVLIMQAEDDARPKTDLHSSDISTASSIDKAIPGWTIPRPPPRKFGEILHPAKYPETLVSEFIELFTDERDNVFDPMVGTGSTVVAATRVGRNGYGVDLVQEFVDIARQRVSVSNTPTLFGPSCEAEVFQGDSTDLRSIPELSSLEFEYAITSPPYWSMLSNPGSENQKPRRQRDLQLTYSKDERDIGNEEDYDAFLGLLKNVYEQVATKLAKNGVLTVIVKNVKRDHVIYPLGWDIVRLLAGEDGQYKYLGTTLWCQDNVGLKPFAVGIHWVSNILHQYCLHFRKCN